MPLGSWPHESDVGASERGTTGAPATLPAGSLALLWAARGRLRASPSDAARALRLSAREWTRHASAMHRRRRDAGQRNVRGDTRRNDGSQEQVRRRDGSAAPAIARRGGAVRGDGVEQAADRSRAIAAESLRFARRATAGRPSRRCSRSAASRSRSRPCERTCGGLAKKPRPKRLGPRTKRFARAPCRRPSAGAARPIAPSLSPGREASPASKPHPPSPHPRLPSRRDPRLRPRPGMSKNRVDPRLRCARTGVTSDGGSRGRRMRRALSWTTHRRRSSQPRTTRLPHSSVVRRRIQEDVFSPGTRMFAQRPL